MLSNCTVKPRFTDTHLIRTPHCYGNFTFSPGKESAHISSKFNPFITGTLSLTPSVSELTGFDCTPKSVSTALSLSTGFSDEFEVATIVFDR